jgi:8-amino-3,8-dideoxy-alpha-D-manno-octulosonate transaminase
MPGFELIGDEERAAVNEVFDDGGILFRHGFDAMRKGRYRVVEFETAFAEWLGTPYGLAVSSGTAAVRVALAALRVQPGDEVITQSFTFVATVEAILDAGAVPVVVDVDDTLNIDPAALEAAISPRTKGVVPVHMLGVAADMAAVGAVADAHGLWVLEDNCESLGATYRGSSLGTLGDVGAFSLDMGKVITCGEGGVVTTADEETYKLAREYHDHGHENDLSLPRGRDTRRIRGFNFRLTEVQGAIAMAQLRKLDDLIVANRRNSAAIERPLREIDALTSRRIPDGCEPLGDTVIFELPTADAARAMVSTMSEQGLGTKNVPDAIEWHFAGYWDHIFGPQIVEQTRRSRERLERCVAIPVMARPSEDESTALGERLAAIARQVT